MESSRHLYLLLESFILPAWQGSWQKQPTGTAHWALPCAEGCRKQDQKGRLAVVVPQGMVPSITLTYQGPYHRLSSQRRIQLSGYGAGRMLGTPHWGLGSRRWTPSLPSERWALGEGLHLRVKELQEISNLGKIWDNESKKLWYSSWQINVSGCLSPVLVQHGEQRGAVRDLCAVTGLWPGWGHRETWWDSSQECSDAMNGYVLFGRTGQESKQRKSPIVWESSRSAQSFAQGLMVSQLGVYWLT